MGYAKTKGFNFEQFSFFKIIMKKKIYNKKMISFVSIRWSKYKFVHCKFEKKNQGKIITKK